MLGKSFFKRIRNTIDYPLYEIKIGCIDAISIAINTIFLVKCLADTNFSDRLDWWFYLFFVLSIVWQLISLVSDYWIYVRKTDFHVELPSGNEGRFMFTEDVKKDYKMAVCPSNDIYCIYSNMQNEYLNHPIDVVPSNVKRARIESYIRIHKFALTRFLNIKWHEIRAKNGYFFNDKKACLASEIVESFDEGTATYSVYVYKGNYYNSYITNCVYTMKLCNQKGIVIEAPLNYSNDPIRTLDKSMMSDHIGVSTLAMTNDGYLLIMRHNNRVAITPNTLHPSGSGSMDYADINQVETLNEAIVNGAERELMEETGIKKENIEYTRIIGFYRDLNRGGKPEYCCITKLNKPKSTVFNSISPDSSEQRDDFDLSIKITRDKVFVFDALDTFIEDRIKQCSCALVMNYFMLCKHSNHHPVSIIKDMGITDYLSQERL